MLGLSKCRFVGSKLIAPIFIFIFVFVSLASSQEVTIATNIVTAPFGQNFDLKRTCSNNGTYCSTSTSCNVTIIKPDGALMLNNRATTNNLAYYNITINSSSNNFLGRGYGSITCTDPSGNIKGNGFATFNYDVTGDGNAYRNFPHQFLILIIGIGLAFFGKLKEELSLVQSLGAMIVMVMGVVTLYPGYSYINYSNLTGVGIGTTSLGLGFYFLIERYFSRDRQVDTYQSQDDGRFHD